MKYFDSLGGAIKMEWTNQVSKQRIEMIPEVTSGQLASDHFSDKDLNEKWKAIEQGFKLTDYFFKYLTWSIFTIGSLVVNKQYASDTNEYHVGAIAISVLSVIIISVLSIKIFWFIVIRIVYPLLDAIEETGKIKYEFQVQLLIWPLVLLSFGAVAFLFVSTAMTISDIVSIQQHKHSGK